MQDIIKSGGQNIKNLIYEIRGKQVMLDSDLARLYQCKNGTKVINQAVSRHKDRFPEDFCFQLAEADMRKLRSQLVTANSGRMSRTMPYVFTEQGVAMLATVLKTEIAAEVSVLIMRAFVTMRRVIRGNLAEQKYINKLVLEDHERLSQNIKDVKLLHASFQQFEEKRKDSMIFFDSQFFDASLNYLGRKTFSVIKMDDDDATSSLRQKVAKILAE